VAGDRRHGRCGSRHAHYCSHVAKLTGALPALGPIVRGFVI
jgi:hypothetical protein